MSVNDYSQNPASNTSISGINVAEGCAASNINDAIRQLMADIAAFVPTVPQSGNNLSDLTDPAAARDNLGLGTAAVEDTGTSGHKLGFLDIQNTYADTQHFIGGASFGDNAYAAFMSGGSANLYFDTDDAVYFDRASNTMGFVINGQAQMWMNTGGMSLLHPLGLGSGGTGSTSAAGARSALDLNTGTSGHTVPYLDNPNTWSNWQNFLVGFGIDGGYYTQISGGNPVINFDSGDYMYYERAANRYHFVANGFDQMWIDAGGISLANKLAVSQGGTGAADATGARANLGLTLGTSGYTVPLCQNENYWGGPQHFMDSGFYIQYLSGSAFINFDANDYIYYNRGNDMLGFYAGGQEHLRIDSNYVYLTPLKGAANDAGAAGQGVPVGAIYRNGSVLQVRVS